MSRIGIIGTKSFTNTVTVSKLFSLIRGKFGPYAIISTGGNETGAENIAKKIALEMGYTYKEFNPSYTGYRMCSAMPEEYYSKQYHYSHLMDRYKHLVNECDYLFIFIEKGLAYPSDLNYAISWAKKCKRKFTIIN